MRFLIVLFLGLLLAPVAQAQFIDCAGGCSETLYGLGNDPVEGPFTTTVSRARVGPGDGSCGAETEVRFLGQIRIREQDSCVASASSRCQVEIPNIADDSGWFVTIVVTLDLGPLGLVRAGGSALTDAGGNIGHRQLSGTCGVSGDECALDSECDAQNPGDVCTSTCFGSGAACSAEDDAVCPGLCRTEIEWDGIGVCSDATTVCNSDADCPGADVCFAGFEWQDSLASCSCCQSALGVVCPILPGSFVEYPAISCGGVIDPRTNHVAASDWLFDGGRGTRFGPETIQVPGQQEGLCTGNRTRPCGSLGDFWAGGANGKCTGEPTCGGDPFSEDNLAIASTCDDVDFGGVTGDFCDLSERGVRQSPLNPDGTPNAALCPSAVRAIVGTPNTLCAIPNDIPDGDPQPGCQLINLGIVGEPDLDCDGIVDTTQGRCMPEGGAICSNPSLCPSCAADGECASGVCINNGPLCPFIAEVDWFLDSNNDDIGDECQCGDGNGDGAVSGLDIAAVALCANGVAPPESCDATIVDATGDNAITAEDLGGVVAVVNGVITTGALECLRNIDSSLR